MSTSRNFILTLNEATLEFYTDIKQYLIQKQSFQYFLCCEHFGQPNKHYHIFVQFKNPAYLSPRKLHGAHFEKSYGSAQQNIAYLRCEDEKHKKDGIVSVLIEEIGEPLLKGGNFSVKNLKELDDPDELPAVLYHTWKKVKYDSKIVKARDFRKNVQVYWIQGPSGIGKTQKAIEIAEEKEELWDSGTDFIKYVNNFYLGTTPSAKIAIYDDFRDSHMKPSEFINLIDYNKHWMNIKGDSILNNYVVIIITSVQRFSEIYRNVSGEPREQWERRVDVINMFPPERVHIGGLPLGYRTDFNQFENYEINTDSDTVVVDNLNN